VVVGYSVGLLVGLYFVESLIHLPVLNLVRLAPVRGLQASPQPSALATHLTRAAPPPPHAQVIGFPLELLGVMSAGALALRYTVEGVDPTTDLAKVQATLQDTLPGLK
jgi:hypothetical protein